MYKTAYEQKYVYISRLEARRTVLTYIAYVELREEDAFAQYQYYCTYGLVFGFWGVLRALVCHAI